MLAVVVKRFVGSFNDQAHYSIRKHPNGSFQAFHDNYYEGVYKDLEKTAVPITGLFADVESVEAELLQHGLIQP